MKPATLELGVRESARGDTCGRLGESLWMTRRFGYLLRCTRVHVDNAFWPVVVGRDGCFLGPYSRQHVGDFQTASPAEGGADYSTFGAGMLLHPRMSLSRDTGDRCQGHPGSGLLNRCKQSDVRSLISRNSIRSRHNPICSSNPSKANTHLARQTCRPSSKISPKEESASALASP